MVLLMFALFFITKDKIWVTMPKQPLRLHGRGENFKDKIRNKVRQRSGRKVETTTKIRNRASTKSNDDFC